MLSQLAASPAPMDVDLGSTVSLSGRAATAPSASEIRIPGLTVSSREDGNKSPSRDIYKSTYPLTSVDDISTSRLVDNRLSPG